MRRAGHERVVLGGHGGMTVAVTVRSADSSGERRRERVVRARKEEMRL